MNIIVSVVGLLAGIIGGLGIYIIYRNHERTNELKRREGKYIIGKKAGCKEIPGRPRRYIVEVEFEMDNTIKCKKIVTSDKKIKKYADGEEIPLLYVDAVNKVFWAEDNSHEWLWLMAILSFFCALMLLCSGTFLLSYLGRINLH